MSFRATNDTWLYCSCVASTIALSLSICSHSSCPFSECFPTLLPKISFWFLAVALCLLCLLCLSLRTFQLTSFRVHDAVAKGLLPAPVSYLGQASRNTQYLPGTFKVFKILFKWGKRNSSCLTTTRLVLCILQYIFSSLYSFVYI